MNELQIFVNPEFGKIRGIEIDGEPWIVGKDVAVGLGYKDTVNALKAHVDDEDRRGWRITTPSGEQEMTVINESGLYSLVLSSKLPGAFQSTLPLRGATNHTKNLLKNWIFQSTLPLRGATIISRGRAAVVSISIHTPLTGSDYGK